MSVISFAFIAFLLAGAILFYIVPHRFQWIILVILSTIYYLLAAVPYTIIYVLISTMIAYVSTNIIVRLRLTEAGKKFAKTVMLVAVFLNLSIWFLLKGSAFWSIGTKTVHFFFPTFMSVSSWPYAVAMGIGYYTAQIIGYILDCYWENAEPQRNFLKLFLFVCFFPQMTVGPISRYSQMQTLYKNHKFSYQNLCLGSQRILWGFFKKLVISDRVGIIVNAIWADTRTYSGFWVWLAVLMYPLQIYTDFSGCMDIVLGAAEIFDICLPENFDNPFFSRNCQELWHRWHITLGTWAKDYVYYPALKSKVLVNIGKCAKKYFNKRVAKWIPWSMGLGILWLVMGLWHGTVQYVLGVSFWFWAILVISEIFTPLYKKGMAVLKINAGSFSWHLFQSVRTYILFALGVVFFTGFSLEDSVERYKALWAGLKNLNPWIFFDGSILNLGVTWRDVNIIVIGIICLFIVAVLREKYGYARTWIQEQILPFRWFIWVTLFVLVLVYGLYGPTYDASQFIYQGF